MGHGWDESAAAWIAEMGEAGDFGRHHVLDAPMLARVRGRGFRDALDLGCGEGRFCRMLRAEGVAPTGLDPTWALVTQARHRDPGGTYCLGRAEALPFPDRSFDLVVSYLTLIDVPDLAHAISEAARVLRRGGALLVANLTSFSTAGGPQGWRRGPDRKWFFVVDRYLEERAEWVEWGGIRVRNWHRPLGRYMELLLGAGLLLRHFAEPAPSGGPEETAERHRRVPYFLVMEWQKPER